MGSFDFVICYLFLLAQEAEMKAKNMEEEICRLQKSLEERNGELQSSASTAEKVRNLNQVLLY